MKTELIRRYTIKEAMALIHDKKIENSTFEDWSLSNNMIEKVNIVCIGHFGGLMSLDIRFLEHHNLFGLSNMTFNLGLILRELALFIGVVTDDGVNVIDALRNQPVRLLTFSKTTIARPAHSFIGHFVKDEFIWCEDLAKINFKPQKNERSGK